MVRDQFTIYHTLVASMLVHRAMQKLQHLASDFPLTEGERERELWQNLAPGTGSTLPTATNPQKVKRTRTRCEVLLGCGQALNRRQSPRYNRMKS